MFVYKILKKWACKAEECKKNVAKTGMHITVGMHTSYIYIGICNKIQTYM